MQVMGTPRDVAAINRRRAVNGARNINPRVGAALPLEKLGAEPTCHCSALPTLLPGACSPAARQPWPE
jgi:hypothetical protein